MSEVSDFIRKSFKEGDDKRDAGLKTPENVERFDNLCYGPDPKWQTLDVYRPKGCKEMLPVIVSVHGGGWVYGDKERYQFYCMSLVKFGFAVVNFTYRLAPEFKFPCPLEDTNLVMQWIKDNAKKYLLDTDKICAVGDSAGGNILGLYAAILTDKNYAAAYSFKTPEGISLKAIGLNCGVYDINVDETKGHSDKDLMMEYLPCGGTPEEIEKVNVIKHITKGYPPTFFMTCYGDFLVGEAPKMAKVLHIAKVPHVGYTAGSEENPLYHVFHLNMKQKESDGFNKLQCEFFKNYI